MFDAARKISRPTRYHRLLAWVSKETISALCPNLSSVIMKETYEASSFIVCEIVVPLKALLNHVWPFRYTDEHIFCRTVEAIVALQELTVMAKSLSQKIGDYCRKKITFNLILSAS